jgi:tetratricopeptide (TPR) repeat protein
VALVVEGRLRQQGQKLNISVQLIEGRTGLSLWSEGFDRDPDEVSLMQVAITGPIVRLLLPDAGQAVAEPVTRNVSANELMLLARHYEQIVRDKQEVDTDVLSEAIRLYRAAIAADPDSAVANSRLAGALLYSGSLEAAQAPIFKALTLEPDISEVQYTLGLYYFARGLPGAGAAFRRAIELNPNNPDALESYARWSWMQGRTEGVEVLLRRAVDIDPLSLARYGTLGTFLGVETTPQKVLTLASKVESLFEGPEAYRLLGQLMELTGRVDEAIAWTIRARDLETENPDHVHRLAELYALIGDFDVALTLEPQPGIGLLYRMRRYEELIQIAEFVMIEEPQDIPLRYVLAFAYNATGQYQNALRVLESTGLPGSVLEETRFSADKEAFISLMDAAYQTGEIALARELAGVWTNGIHPVNLDWWQDVYAACALSVLGSDKSAFERLERTRNSPRLPPDTVLQDSPCFQHYSEEPVYQETLRFLDERRAALRERLPATLARFEVSL